jgi:hypothetical protein
MRTTTQARSRLCLQILEDRITPDALVNDNAGSTGTADFTQGSTTLVAFDNTVVVAFNDSGSLAGGANKLTGWARSTTGGSTFADGGTLPTSTGGDAGNPVLARNSTTGRIYLTSQGFNVSTVQVFRSDDGGASWMAPVNGTPGGSNEDRPRMAVDNFAGPGQGNVYVVARDFGSLNGIYLYRSTDNGATFGPSGGTLIVSGNEGPFVTVGPDHAVYVFWYAGTTIQMRKSIDQGVSFGAAVTVASGLVGGTSGDLGLTGLRQGTATASGFRTNEFPHVAINPAFGNIYVTFPNDGPGADRADVFLVQSSDGGATWSSPLKVNDDATTTDQWAPTLAVTPDGTRLGIFYYSRQEDPAGNNLYKFYGRIGSVNSVGFQPVTFGPSFAATSAASVPEFGRDASVVSTYFGDYNQAVATNTAFHVVWSDSRFDLSGGAPRKDPSVFYNQISLPARPPRVASVSINDGAAQRSRLTNATVTFNTQVTFAGAIAAAFGLSRNGGGSIGGFTAMANVINGVTVVTLSGFTGAETEFGSLIDGRYTLTVRSNQISAGGLALDGDGNGAGGDDFTFGSAQGLFRYFGDVNGDATVNGFDLGFFRNAFGSSAGDPSFLSFFDINGDGTINGFDLGQFRTRFGTTLP